MKKCVLICNPNSGKNNKKSLVHDFKNVLFLRGYETEVFFTKYLTRVSSRGIM